MANTKAPSGIAITRSKEKLVIKWKQKDNYTSQQLQYKLHTGSKKDAWKSISVGASTTAKSLTIDRDKYHPNKNKGLNGITFRIRGKASNKSWSAWTSKGYDILKPNKPIVAVEQDSTLPNKVTFSWALAKSDTDRKIYTKTQRQSLLVAGSANPNWSKASYTLSGQDSVNGTATYTEDTSVIADGSHTRYFRIRAVGPQGASDWVEKKFVHALPFQANNVVATVTETEEGGLNAVVTWTTKIDKAHPVAKTTVQYAMVVPEANLECPSGASWVDGNISQDIVDKSTNTATSKAVFSIDDVLAKDECLFVRVNTQHAEEENINYGQPVLAQVGYLKDPTDLSVSNIDTSTHRVTISVTNASDVTDSKVAIVYRTAGQPDTDFIIAVLPYNNTYTKVVQCPDWGTDTIAFGAYAVVGDVEEKTREDGVGSYTIDEKMRSENVLWAGGSVPQAPTEIDAFPTEIAGTIRVTWNWSWEEADSAILSWADHEDAWESTDEPEEFTISKIHASQWNISGLETGKTWYVRIRLVAGMEDNLTYGPWSKIVSVDLSSAPNIPTLVLSEDVITVDGTVTASWAYSSTDATAQAYAKICEVEITSEGLEYGDLIAHATTAQHVDISVVDGWQAGETHYLCLNVMSASGRESNWSDPVSITIAEPLTCEITATSLEEVTEEIDGTTYEFLALTELPMTVTVEGAGESGTTTVAIERFENYHMTRPDESEFNGYEGETVYLNTQTGDAEMEIILDDLIGTLDDEASYLIVATVKDAYGQSASAQLDFVVMWGHQAIMPTATVVIDDEEYIAKITVPQPSGAITGDTFDIYRLSADKPEKIIEDGIWGTAYVDPYPALGDYGYRVCFKTLYGDYITANKQPAWVDVEEGLILEDIKTIIDFDGIQIPLTRNVNVGNSWEKAFEETRYLGGSIQGDWNIAVGRSSTATTTALTLTDQDIIDDLRRLAIYAGICHIRTFDGSSFACDIQVAEDRDHESYGALAEFSFTVTKVDPEDMDGLTLAEWEA